jgi:predicted RNase H-like HicB family nuclease
MEYSVVQTANGWKWIVFLDATKTRTGTARTRAHAILDAEHAIDMALKAVAAEPTQLKKV